MTSREAIDAFNQIQLLRAAIREMATTIAPNSDMTVVRAELFGWVRMLDEPADLLRREGLPAVLEGKP